MVATQRYYNLLTQLPSGFVRMSAAVDGSPSRYRKQVLRIGRYVVSGKPVEITGDDLAALSHNFALAVARGNKIPVVWGHPENLIDPRSNLGHVESLTLDQGALIAEFSIPDEADARRIDLGIADQVSVGIAPWTDGEGNEYWPMLQHLGVVNLPVMANQQPTTRLLSTLSNVGAKTMSLFGLGKSTKGKKNFAAGDAGGDTVAAMTVDGTATLADAWDQIQGPLETICEAAGVNLPTDASPDTLVVILKVLAGQLGGDSEPDPEDPSEGGEAAPSMPADVGPVPMSTLAKRKVSAVISSRDAQIKKLQAELSTIKSSSQTAAKIAFENCLEGHVKAGRITPADRAVWSKTGEASGFNLSTLAVLDKLPATIPTGRKLTAANMATGNVPGGGAEKEETPEERRARARQFAGLPAKK